MEWTVGACAWQIRRAVRLRAAGERFDKPMTVTDSAAPPNGRRRTAGLTLAALGVVFGDIGTSPLYTMSTCFSDYTGIKPTPENVLGILSLITWALIIVVTLKYVVVVMRADNHGEGGVLALMALVSQEA